MGKHDSNPAAARPNKVVIIGGSLAGLMHGIMLHRLGSTVLVLERSPAGTPLSHMAGVGLGNDVQQLLKRFDGAAEVPLGIPAVQLQSLDSKGTVHPFMKVNRMLSSWDALYFRLRANFDARASEYVPQPPAPVPRPGEDADSAKARAVYQAGAHVTNIEELETGQLRVQYGEHTHQGKASSALADMVIGADGPNSVVRKLFLEPGRADRLYCGYVAWRGVVPEDHVSKETRDIFRSNITYSVLNEGGGHVIVYYIPGEGGSVEPGHRLINFCWYTNVSANELDNIMTDVDGVRHHTQLPPGKVRPEVWEKQRSLANKLFATPYLEVLEKVESPFLHQITDYCSPKASFAGGKVLMVGDAATLLRPHIAFSTNQAAYHTMITERLVKGEITIQQWDYQVTAAAYLHWRRSVWFGEFFQRPLYVSIGSAVAYWGTAALARIRIGLKWLPQQAV